MQGKELPLDGNPSPYFKAGFYICYRVRFSARQRKSTVKVSELLFIGFLSYTAVNSKGILPLCN